MKPTIQSKKIVVLTGSGISAESGLPTFRDSNGLWSNHSWESLASPDGWQANPELVLEFYNERRQKAWQASPNASHKAIASLESKYEVIVVTQNVDDLHERAGSSCVIHLHGQLAYARSTLPTAKRYRINADPIKIGQICEDGAQLRPDIVWFGEPIQFFEDARAHMKTASRVLVVGTSLSVYPAASLVNAARGHAEKILVAYEVARVPRNFKWIRGKATEIVPHIVNEWLTSLAASSKKSASES